MRKNGFTMVELIAIVVIMASMLLVILPSINNTIKQSEEKKKQENLNNIYMAAENYLMDNYENYRINNAGDTTYIYITDLINNNYMSINTLNPNNDSSFTKNDAVKVTRNKDNTFHYELDYIKTLIETLLEQYSPDNTTGLVKDATNENLYYYTGTNEQVANNFLWYGGHQWRVLEFDTSTNTLTLITQQPLTAIQPASKPWTTKESYESSYINTWLNEYFWNSLDSSIQNNVLDSTFNIGIYTDVDEITTTQKVGLLDEDQYKRAGNTDSFLDIKDYFWLGNAYSSSYPRIIDKNGIINNDGTYFNRGVRAVIKISNIIITGGSGTLVDSYQTSKKAINTNDILIGEYINVPYNGDDNACGNDNMCTFRVVSKDNDSIKITLNGLLSNYSQYGNSTTISTSHTMYITLNNFAEGISDMYRYTKNKTFYIGDYHSFRNYKDIEDETLEASIGLPTVGEMFSGNDIDLGYNKVFVDENTIENSKKISYVTMNRFDSSNIVGAIDSGTNGAYNFSTSSIYGVRPVLFLKNNIEFTGGNGTAQSPYTLE